jgi:hypothetical protein
MTVLPQAFQLPTVRTPLTVDDKAFVLALPTTGTIAGAERTRLTLVRDSAQASMPASTLRPAVARLAQ